MRNRQFLGKTGVGVIVIGLFAWLGGGLAAFGQSPTEACCTQNGSCFDLDPAVCIANGGIPAGPGTTCNQSVCTERPCCLPDGTCIPGISPLHCQAQGGVPQPIGSSCSSLHCPVGGDQCQPSTDGKTCSSTQCPVLNEKCLPNIVHFNPATGQYKIIDCDCSSSQECHVDIGAAGPTCVGGCPGTTQQCEPIVQQLPNGGYSITCQCKPCDSNDDCEDGNLCTKDYCDPATGQCVHDPVVCDDGNPCTIDSCDADTGICVFLPVVCPDDGNVCTQEYCNPDTGQCVQTTVNCDDGDPCTNDICDPAVGCVHTPIPGCGVSKWSQRPTPDREDIASNIWISPNGIQQVNVVAADDFRSDGRPITSVRWWGSYLNPEYAPKEYGGAGQSPFMIDGWLISFHRPLKWFTGAPPKPLLGLYFAPASAVQITPTSIPPCDQHPVFEYVVDLAKCCLIQSFPDIRLPATHPKYCPAKPEAFYENRCFWYNLDIQAVVGSEWVPVAGAVCCERKSTQNYALANFWGWHTTDIEKGLRPAIRTIVTLGNMVDTPCPPLSQCPSRQWLYGPWGQVPPVCTFPHRINLAFELITTTTVVPPPCPPLHIISATSVKTHGGPVPVNLGIDLPLASPVGVEDRRGGVTKVVIHFSEEIAADDESLDPADEVVASVGTITGLSIAGSQLTVELSGVPDASCLSLTIENTQDGITTLGSDPLDGVNEIFARVLLGDANGSGAVNLGDMLLVKSKSGADITLPGNAVFDVDASGAINLGDVLLTKSRSGQTAVCP